jgi:GntR family transcriptional regulator
VRKLAEDLVINPNTVARAYRELESSGAITTRRGAGVYVADGGSPLADAEKTRIIDERIDMLLAEARQLGISLEELQHRLEARARHLHGDSS